MKSRRDRQPTESLQGSITSVGFSSGHQFVVGHWPVSPVGPFADVMWRGPEGSKTLIASAEAADYITGIYPFDHLVAATVTITDDVGGRVGNRLAVESDPLTLSLTIGRLVIPFPSRPRWVTETVERWMARALLGVNTHGLSPTGVEEWYRTRSVRRVVGGRGKLHGTDLGTLARLNRPMEVGSANRQVNRPTCDFASTSGDPADDLTPTLDPAGRRSERLEGRQAHGYRRSGLSPPPRITDRHLRRRKAFNRRRVSVITGPGRSVSSTPARLAGLLTHCRTFQGREVGQTPQPVPPTAAAKAAATRSTTTSTR